VHYTSSCNTQSSAPEDERDHRPKHVELIGIINKPLLLHLFGVYIIYVNDAWSIRYQSDTCFAITSEIEVSIHRALAIHFHNPRTSIYIYIYQ